MKSTWKAGIASVILWAEVGLCQGACQLFPLPPSLAGHSVPRTHGILDVPMASPTQSLKLLHALPIQTLFEYLL